MSLPQLALPSRGFELVLGPPRSEPTDSSSLIALSAKLAGAVAAAGLARQRIPFPWTWLVHLEDLPLPSAMITSLTAGGVVYALQLAALLGRNVPMAAKVKERLAACCRRLGIDPGQPIPDWWVENLDALETTFGSTVKHKVIEHISWQLPLSASQTEPYTLSAAVSKLPQINEPLWNTLPLGLAVPAVRRPATVLPALQPLPVLAAVNMAGPAALRLALALPLSPAAHDRVWLWQTDEPEPICYQIDRAEDASWIVEGVAGPNRVFAAALEREGASLGSWFRSPGELAEVILSTEGWQCTASWLRWSQAPVFDGLVQRAVARRVKAEPEASLAAWLAPIGPDGLESAERESSAALLQEFFANWWASADDADAMLRAARLQGEDPDAWVRLASAHPVLLGQVLFAGWLRQPVQQRKALFSAVCDRLATWILPEGRGGEVHWETAEQTALSAAAKDWGVGEWMFTSRGQAGALSDWMTGKPVPPEMRRRWISAWASPACCQWSSLRLVRELLADTGERARSAGV